MQTSRSVTRMSGITGVANSTLASLLAGGNSSSSDTSAAAAQTPLQRAQALAASIGSGVGNPQQAQLIAQAEQSALGAELASALNTGDTSYGPAYDLSTGAYNYAYSDTADTLSSSLLDQIGALTPATQWQQIQTPSGNTPGESQTVAAQDQISYLQNVTPSDSTAVSPSRNAPSLGTIGTNAGRLVLLGSLSSDQTDVQSYNFNLQQAGQLHILAPDPNSTDPTASLGPVHMQVYDGSGTLVADSDPTSGEPYLNYVKLDQTAIAGADFNAGTYTVKLSYNSNAPASAKGDYSLFIESGTDPGRVSYYTTALQPGATQTASQPAPAASTYSPAVSLLA
jgi:hypothetical protein